MEMEGILSKKDVSKLGIGSYLYRYGNSTSWRSVELEETDGELFVRFQAGYYPTKLSEIPDIGEFKKVS
jgi:hypothetical protein